MASVYVDPLENLKAQKLNTACKTAFKQLGWFREVYCTARDQMAGPWHFNEMAAADRWSAGKLTEDSTQMPINLLDELVTAYLPNLTGSQITVKITAKRPSLKGWAALRALKLNHELQMMNFADLDRQVVQDAMLSGQGCFRIGINQGSDVLHLNHRIAARIQPGQSFVKRVSPMRIIRDPEAMDEDSQRFYGEIYRVEKDWAMMMGIFDNDVFGSLKTSAETRRLDDGTKASEELDIVETVELIDLTIFRNGKAFEMTLPMWETGHEDKFLIEPRESDACELGVLEFLTFQNVNERIIGKSPAQSIMDLHLAMAKMGRRAIEQILAHKRNGVYKQDQSDLADELRTAAPEEWIAGDPTAVAQIISGGMTKEAEIGIQFMRQESNRVSANPQVSGTGGNSETATESSILAGKSQVILQSVRERVNASRERVMMRLSNYEDTYQGQPQTLTHDTPDGQAIEMIYDPSTREGKWTDFNHDIKVTTTQAQEPNMRQARMIQVMQAGPAFIGAAMQTGGDPSAAADFVTKEFDCPSFGEIYPTPMGQQIDAAMGQMVQPPQQAQGQRQIKGGKSKMINQVRSDMAPGVPNQSGI